MQKIHPTAIIANDVKFGENVKVGPWCVIGDGVELGNNTIIESHVVIKGPTQIGENNHIYQFSSIGEDTPDLKYDGEPTRLIIGDHNIIREGVTIHRGTVQDKSETRIGSHNLIMAYVHIGHDSVVGNHCILVNNAALAGHVIVDDYAILGGFTLVHQFVRIGAHCFTGMGCAVGKDIPAFVMVSGAPAAARNINMEGLKRRGFTKDDIAALVKAYKILYRKSLTVEQAIAEISLLESSSLHIRTFIDSLHASTRGIVR